MPRPPRRPDELAHLSHEVRTHVHGLLGLLDWLRESRLSAAQRDGVCRLQDGGRALLGLVDALLTPDPAEAGFVPAEITEDVAGLLAPLVAKDSSVARPAKEATASSKCAGSKPFTAPLLAE